MVRRPGRGRRGETNESSSYKSARRATRAPLRTAGGAPGDPARPRARDAPAGARAAPRTVFCQIFPPPQPRAWGEGGGNRAGRPGQPWAPRERPRGARTGAETRPGTRVGGRATERAEDAGGQAGGAHQFLVAPVVLVALPIQPLRQQLERDTGGVRVTTAAGRPVGRDGDAGTGDAGADDRPGTAPAPAPAPAAETHGQTRAAAAAAAPAGPPSRPPALTCAARRHGPAER